LKRFAASILATGLLAALWACDTSDSVTNPDAPVEDPTGAWALQAFELSDGRVIGVPDPSSYTLDLGLTEAGRAHIRADCNLCNGAYEVSGSTLTFGLMACTLAACPPGSLENDYRFALGSTTAYQRSGSSLTLTYDGGVMRFVSR